MLIAYTFVSLAVNAYVFLFRNRTLFLYIVHALLPLVLAAYPLSTASWVTKQYHWLVYQRRVAALQEMIGFYLLNILSSKQ